MSTTRVLVCGAIDHVIAVFEIDLSPTGEGGFLYIYFGDSILSFLEQIQLFHIFELYPRGFYVPPLAAQNSTNRSFTGHSYGKFVDVHIICTYFLMLVQWSTILSSICYRNPSFLQWAQRFSAMELAANSSTTPSGSWTLYSLMLRSELSLEMPMGLPLILR